MPPIPKKQPFVEEQFYTSADGVIVVARQTQKANVCCVVAEPQDCERCRKTIIALDGSRVVRRIGRLVEKGDIDAKSLPRIVGIDFEDPLNDCTPWWHPAFKEGAPDFGGGADAFLSTAVLPVAQAELQKNDAGDTLAPLALLGYSLGGLLCLQALIRTDVFDTYLIASPSTWYPGFVNKLARTPIQGSPRIIIACGQDEGLDHPEPIRGTRQDTERTVEVLADKLKASPYLFIDDFDHHQGFTARLKHLLAAF